MAEPTRVRRGISPGDLVLIEGGVVEQRHRDSNADITGYSVRWSDGRLFWYRKEHVQAAPPEWAYAEGEEWRRVPSTMLMAWHPEDEIWIAEDLTRRGCWASAATPDEALRALEAVTEDYDDAFGAPDVPRPDRTPTRKSSLRGGVIRDRSQTSTQVDALMADKPSASTAQAPSEVPNV